MENVGDREGNEGKGEGHRILQLSGGLSPSWRLQRGGRSSHV